MARVAGLHQIALRVPNLDAVANFYKNLWGMEPVTSGGDERQFKSRGVADPDLVFRSGGKEGLEYIALGVRSAADLDAIIATVEKAGHKVAREANGANVRDPDGNLVKLTVSPKAGVAQKLQEPVTGPRKIGHIVLWTPQRETMERSEERRVGKECRL